MLYSAATNKRSQPSTRAYFTRYGAGHKSGRSRCRQAVLVQDEQCRERADPLTLQPGPELLPHRTPPSPNRLQRDPVGAGPPPEPAAFSTVAEKKLPPPFNHQLLSLTPMHTLLINMERGNSVSKVSSPRSSCINSIRIPGLSDLVPSIISQMKLKYSALPQNNMTGPLVKGSNAAGAAQTSIFSGKKKCILFYKPEKLIFTGFLLGLFSYRVNVKWQKTLLRQKGRQDYEVH